MASNQPIWPRQWLMTDERIGARLQAALDALPAGSGVVLRHYSLAADDREKLAWHVAAVCLDRDLTLAVAGNEALALRVGAALVHNPASPPQSLPFSRSAHSMEEALAACASGASLLFVSPIFPTRSHPGTATLGAEEALCIAAACPVPAIALGGVSAGNAEPLLAGGFHGWAGIDAWLSA